MRLGKTCAEFNDDVTEIGIEFSHLQFRCDPSVMFRGSMIVANGPTDGLGGTIISPFDSPFDKTEFPVIIGALQSA